VPLSPAARTVLAADPALLVTVLTGGDDYEIVASVSEHGLSSLQAAAKQAGIEITTIGRIEAGEGIEVIGDDGKRLALARPSFSHF
jgi:thiamine-monophosphate kinase